MSFEEKLRARQATTTRDARTPMVKILPAERDALADAVEALRVIASPDELVDANEDVFSIHAFRRTQETARWALTRLDATE